MGTSPGSKEHCIGQGRQDVRPLAACHLIRDSTRSYGAVWDSAWLEVKTTGGQRGMYLWCQHSSWKADESRGTRFWATFKWRLWWVSGIFWLLIISSLIHFWQLLLFFSSCRRIHCTWFIQLGLPTPGLDIWLRPSQSEHLTTLAILIGLRLDNWLNLANHNPPETFWQSCREGLLFPLCLPD